MIAHSTGRDVIVVGGGPAGASTALALARAGVGVLVLDRARFPRAEAVRRVPEPAGVAAAATTWARSTRSKRAGAAQLAGMVVRAPNGAMIRGEFAAAHGFRAFRDRGLAAAAHGARPDPARRARAAPGAEVREGARVADVVRDARGRVTRRARARRRRATSTSGARARRRRRRAALGRRAAGSASAHAPRWPRRLALVAHFEGCGGIGDWGEMHVERDVGYVGIADGGRRADERRRWSCRRARRASVSADRAGASSSGGSARARSSRRAFARRDARRRPCARPGRSRRTRGARGRRAPRSSATRPTSSTRSPARGSTRRCAAASCSRRSRSRRSARASRPRRATPRCARYDARAAREFGGKWIVERLIGAAVGFAPADRTTSRARSQARQGHGRPARRRDGRLRARARGVASRLSAESLSPLGARARPRHDA